MGFHVFTIPQRLDGSKNIFRGVLLGEFRVDVLVGALRVGLLMTGALTRYRR